MDKKPLILITNDDGITAPGIKALIEVTQSIGDVIVVAPNSPQSGMGHAITLDATLHVEPIKASFYSCSGTPADCVKLGIRELSTKRPDLCVSGINHGSNASINVIYSGTMSAALEAGIEGIPAIGFSLLDYNWNANFDAAKPFAKKIITDVLKSGLPKGVVLNVNIPNVAKNEIKGIKVCRQAKGNWEETFDKRKNPQGKPYYWLSGKFVNLDHNKTETDLWALENNYVSIVPTLFDLTAHKHIKDLKDLEH